MLFDTHCHFMELPPPDADEVSSRPSSGAERDAGIAAKIERARAAGLCGILAVGGSEEANAAVLSAAACAPDFVHACIGFDYDEIMDSSGKEDAFASFWKPSFIRKAMELFAAASIPVRAIGEIGLDYTRSEDPAIRAAQRALFRGQLALARECALPCSIHSRGADKDTVEILREYARDAEHPIGAIHCFVGDAAFAEALRELPIYFGLSGILTFRNAGSLRELVKTLPRERLLVETDSPYLSPVPLRGKPCEPAYVAHTAAVLADCLGCSAAEAGALTTENARRLLRLC